MTVVFRARFTHDWLPFPADLLELLGWMEGDLIEIELVDGTLVCTRSGLPAPRAVIAPIRKGKTLCSTKTT